MNLLVSYWVDKAVDESFPFSGMGSVVLRDQAMFPADEDAISVIECYVAEKLDTDSDAISIIAITRPELMFGILPRTDESDLDAEAAKKRLAAEGTVTCPCCKQQVPAAKAVCRSIVTCNDFPTIKEGA